MDTSSDKQEIAPEKAWTGLRKGNSRKESEQRHKDQLY